MPCLIGYGIIARRLFDAPQTIKEGNKYWKWIETYVAQDYAEAMKTGSGETAVNGCCCFHLANMSIDLIEEHAMKQSVSKVEELAGIFIHATKVSDTSKDAPSHTLTLWQMETGFWNMGAKRADTSR